MPRGRGCLPHLRSRALERPAGGCAALVHGFIGVADLHVDFRDRNVEFFRDDLPQRRAGAGAEIDFAGENADGAVRRDRDPGIEFVRRGVRRRSKSACRPAFLALEVLTPARTS